MTRVGAAKGANASGDGSLLDGGGGTGGCADADAVSVAGNGCNGERGGSTKLCGRAGDRDGVSSKYASISISSISRPGVSLRPDFLDVFASVMVELDIDSSVH